MYVAEQRGHTASWHQREERDDSSVCLEESSEPRFIGLLPILSHAQNAAKHIVVVYVHVYICICTHTYLYTYICMYARPEPDNEALPPR